MGKITMFSKMDFFDFALHPTTKITFLLVPIILVLFYVLSLDTARENGPIEDLQVFILCCGAMLAGKTAWQTSSPKDRKIWQSITFIFLLGLGRELGWGGEIFEFEDWVYKKVVYPFLAVIFLLILSWWARNKVWIFVKIKQIPVWDLAIFIGLFFLADCAEHGSLRELLAKGELLEELAESVCYWCMFSSCIIMANKPNVYDKIIKK